MTRRDGVASLEAGFSSDNAVITTGLSTVKCILFILRLFFYKNHLSKTTLSVNLSFVLSMLALVNNCWGKRHFLRKKSRKRRAG